MKQLSQWVVHDSAYLKMLVKSHESLTIELQHCMHYTIYSEGELSYFMSFRNSLREYKYNIETTLILNTPTSTTFEMLSKAHIIILAFYEK